MLSFQSLDHGTRSSILTLKWSASGWPCTQPAPEPTRQAHPHGLPVVSAVKRMPIPVRVTYPSRTTRFGLRPSDTTPDIVIGPAVSPSREIVLHVRISALEIKHTSELLVLPERSAIIVPARFIVIRMLMPSRLPVTPDRSLRFTGVLFRDEDVRAFVGEDVFPSAPRTSRLIIWPHELPSLVFSPRAGWPFWWSTGAPFWLLV